MNKKVECIIAKEALEFLFKTVEELAAKVGIGVAHHGAIDIIGKIKSSIREHSEESPESDKKDVEDK